MRKSSPRRAPLRTAGAFRGALTALLADLRSVAAGAGEAAGVPLASRSATRVSARSTLTSTCFFNLIQSFGIGTGRAPRARAADERARHRRARTHPAGRRGIHEA